MNIETLSALAAKNIEKTQDHLNGFRQDHLNLFKDKGLTSPVKDGYKFTNLETFFASWSQDEKTVVPEFRQTAFPTITFIDGKFNKQDTLPEGVSVKKIVDHFDEIKEKLTESNALSHLHHGLLNDGVVIEIAKNQEIKSPIRILNILTQNKISAPTHLIIAAAYAKGTIIEETVAADVSHALISETYIVAQEGAQLEHICMEQEGTSGINHGSVFAEVAKDATVRSLIFHVTGKLNRKNLILNLNAPGANGESYCLFLTHGTEHSDINTVINHKSADTTSNQMAKGILDGESKGIFTGLIHIFPKAQRVASAQLNKNLLLSKKAQLHSQPQLEIFADDVKCSHGSTTGQLSEDEVFYFQARGIPADKARVLLAHGFGLEIVQKIANKEAREFVSALVMKNLGSKFHLGRQS
ncbi:MAG: Fe-S cluster assembly protein SufD [Bacteriovoracaceae bacterium]|nr:Fe-S cluster assembly protein SufD [Bacteriovoracaceae bacterium]